MRWMIHGADHKTGKELTIVIEADDPRQAEQRALYNDILVSSISRFTDAITPDPPPPPAKPLPTLHYSTPELPPESRPPLAPAPAYKRILSGARWLTGLSIAVRVVGVVGLAAAFLVTLVPLLEPLRLWMPFRVIPVLWFIAGGLLMAMAFLCLFCGATIAMLSDLALAVRDIARNTANDPPDRQPAEPSPPPQPATPGLLLAKPVQPIHQDPQRRPLFPIALTES